MNINKKIIITSVKISAAIIIILLAFKIFFSITISEKVIKSFVTEFVKKSLNKAVIFNDAYVDFTGDVILIDPNLSFEADFNDNQSLIKASKAVIKLKFPEIFIGNYIPKKIIFYNGDITVINRNQEHLPQKLNLKKILSDNISGFDNTRMPGTIIKIKDSKITYIDFLKEKKHVINFYNSDMEFEIQNDKISFNVYTKIQPYKTKDIKNGYIKAKGSVPFDKNLNFSANINIENLDLTNVNEYLEYYGNKSFSISGGFSAELKITNETNSINYIGSIETANLNLTSSQGQHKYISNENMNIVFKLSDNLKDSKIETGLLKISDDNIQLDISSRYNYNPKDENIYFTLKTNKINLGNFSNNFSPSPGIIYAGESSFDIRLAYSMTKENLQDLFIDYKLNGLSVSKLEKSGVKKIISGFNCSLNADNKKIILNSTGLIRDSRASFELKTNIKNLDPFKSDSDIIIHFEKLYSSQIFYLTRMAVESIYITAQEDIKRGYEDIFFLQKSAGKIVNNNNINIRISSEKIQLLENVREKYFSNLMLNLALNNGNLTTSSFSLSGLGANHEFLFNAVMNSDHPFFKIRTSIKDFDISLFSSITGKNSIVSGKMNASFEYDVSAYRFSNILENSKGDFTLTIPECSIANTDFQKNLSKFFSNSGFFPIDLNSSEFKNISLSVGQTAETFHIKNFTIGGSNVSVNGYGKYTMNDGINLPLTINIIEPNPKMTNAPVLIKGRLFNPDLEISNQKTSKTFRLFDVD